MKKYSELNVNDILEHDSFQWKHVIAGNTILYYEENSYASRNIKQIITQSKLNMNNALSILHITQYDHEIHSFFLESRQKMKEIIGFESNGAAYVKSHIMLDVFAEKLKTNTTHELMHIISYNLWGWTEPWLNEGLAVCSDDSWHGYKLDELVSYLMSKGVLIPIADLKIDFYNKNDLITYPQVGSFTKYLIEKYGIDNYRKVWTHGMESIPQVLLHPLDEIEKEWKEFLKEKPIKHIDYKYLK
ncbi:hypothetical protein KAR48_11410 [bacterium]|nr:hypothetical protein [bacterium]